MKLNVYISAAKKVWYLAGVYDQIDETNTVTVKVPMLLSEQKNRAEGNCKRNCPTKIKTSNYAYLLLLFLMG